MEAVVVSTEEVAVFTAAVLLVGSMAEASAAALSTAVVVSVGDVSADAVSTAVVFVVAVLVGATGVAAIGAATGVITDSLMISSSAATAFRGGGTGTIRTDITVTTIIRTITMDTAGTHTVTMGTVTTVAAVTDTAMAADQGISEVFGVGDKPVRLFEIACPLVRQSFEFAPRLDPSWRKAGRFVRRGASGSRGNADRSCASGNFSFSGRARTRPPKWRSSRQ